jgi:hypothetical protein
MREYRDLLEPVHQVVSHWIEQDEDDDGLGACRRDINDLNDARHVVLFAEEPRTPTRGGRLVEFGYGLGAGKDTAIIGCKENIFWHAAHHRFEDWSGYLEFMRGSGGNE